MSLTKAQYAEEKKKIAKNTREDKKVEKHMQRGLNKLVGTNLEKLQEDVVFLLKSIFTLEFQTRRHANVVEAEIGKTIGQFESMFIATKKAIVDLQKTVEILRTFTLFQHVDIYRLQHGRYPTEEEKITLLKMLEYDPEALKRYWRAGHGAQKVKKGVSAVLNA